MSMNCQPRAVVEQMELARIREELGLQSEDRLKCFNFPAGVEELIRKEPAEKQWELARHVHSILNCGRKHVGLNAVTRIGRTRQRHLIRWTLV